MSLEEAVTYNPYYLYYIIEYNPIVRIFCDQLVSSTHSNVGYRDAQY